MKTSINPAATQIEKALGRAYLDFCRNFTRLHTFHVVATAGIEAGLPAVEALLRQSLDELLPSYAAQVDDPEALDALLTSTVQAHKRADTELECGHGLNVHSQIRASSFLGILVRIGQHAGNLRYSLV